MSALETLGLVLGTSFASGLKLYATIAAMGLFHRFGIVHLPDSLQVLAHPIVVGVAITLYVVEFVADKIPFVDSVWDAVHTAIRPPAAAVISYGAFANVPETWRIAAALLAGSVALASHSTKASARAAANASPEPLSNWLLSLTEDGMAVALTWLAITHPIVTIVVVAVLLVVSVYVVWKLFRFLRQAFGRLRRGGQSAQTA